MRSNIYKGLLMKTSKVKVFDKPGDRKSFYSFNLSAELREQIREEGGGTNRGSALDYDQDFTELQVFVELMDLNLYWVYLKDYSFGHMKPFGECIYDFNLPGEPEMPEFYNGEEYIPAVPDFGLDKENHPRDEEYEKRYSEWRESFNDKSRLLLGVLPDLASRIEAGEIDIRQEVYDYYHRIPNEPIPRVEDRMQELISVKDAAEILGVTNSRVKKMVVDRVIDGFSRNGKLYLSKQGVAERAEYIKKHGRPTRGKAKKKGD